MNKIIQMNLTKTSLLFIILLILTFLMFIWDLSVGSVDIPFNEVLQVLFGNSDASLNTQIITNIRLNKALVAILAGAALSVSGLQMQTLFRNPLAGP